MTRIAATLQKFFTQRLALEKASSPNTIASYRDTFRLLLTYTRQQTGTPAQDLDFAQWTPDLITGFLTHLETDRHNSPRTRNARLAAIHSFYQYAALQHPEHAQTIARILAIPAKRTLRADIDYLTDTEEEALINTPDPATWLGRRDRVLLTFMLQTGLRVSETLAVTRADLVLTNPGAYVSCTGKGRKHRATPLDPATTALIADWLDELDSRPDQPVFPTRQARALNRDSIALLIKKHARTAALRCPSLTSKNVTPHVLRHTCGMRLLHAGTDLATIALWLGHEDPQTTQIYLHADMTIKEKALASTDPSTPGLQRYHPDDTLLTFLENL